MKEKTDVRCEEVTYGFKTYVSYRRQ